MSAAPPSVAFLRPGRRGRGAGVLELLDGELLVVLDAHVVAQVLRRAVHDLIHLRVHVSKTNLPHHDARAILKSQAEQ